MEKSGLGDFVDAPVSGGIPAAYHGNLTIMVGGSRKLFERAVPILGSIGKKENIIFCGPPGAGLATKQINNYVANVAYVALCEGTHCLRSMQSIITSRPANPNCSGMNTGIKYGLDPKILAGEFYNQCAN